MAVKTGKPAKPAKPVNRPHPTTVYARTGKGVLSFKNGTAKEPSEVKELFSLIDGKASVADLGAQSEMETSEIEKALDALEEKGYIKVFKQGVDQAVPDFTEAVADAPDLDFTSPGSLLEISVREAAKAKGDAERENLAAAPVEAEAEPQAPAADDGERESLQARIEELEAALAQAEESLGAERAARESAEAEAAAAGRARNEAVKALAQAKASAGKSGEKPAPDAEAGSLQEALTSAQERVAHVELQLETERETREKTVQALRKAQSDAESGRNAAEMRVQEMEIAIEQAQKVERQNRERLKQLETQIETARKSRAEAEAAAAAEATAAAAEAAVVRETLEGQLKEAKAQGDQAAADASQQAETVRQLAQRTAKVEAEVEAERKARAEAEAKAGAEREHREKVARALLEVKKVIGSIEG